jgi:hypothetical protein
MPPLTPDLIRKLAGELAPVLRFSDLERYFPVRAESWLTHVSSAPWSADPDDVGALPADAHRRGTALCASDPEVTAASFTHVAGPPNPADVPLQLAPGGEPESIATYAGAVNPAEELFLSFAGWADPASPAAGGDLDYLYDAFSELASAMNHANPWTPLQARANRPHFAIEQPPSPAAYCEVDWAGAHPRSSDAHGLGDFPPAVRQLDGFLQVTYHLLFPAREALAGQTGISKQEGQWAAVSLFLPGRAGERLDAGGRPEQFTLAWDPAGGKQAQAFVVMSLDANDFMGPTSTVLRMPVDVEALQGHVFTYVGAGTHRLFPHADPEVVMAPPDQWPSLTYEPGSDLEGFLTFAVLGALVGLILGGGFIYVALMIGALGLAAVAIALGIVAAAIVAALILWLLFELLSELWKNDASPSEIPPSGDSPVTPGSSSGDPSAGGASAPTAGDPTQSPQPGATGEVGGTAGGAFWGTNEGAAQGWDTAYTDIKVVSRFAEITRGQTDLEPPAWWDYTGRWGIRVPPAPDPDWISGMRRTDDAGRGWAYWHAHALVNWMVLNAPAPSGP